MPDRLTLYKLSRDLLTELLRSRTDFLLQQTALWQDMNDRSNLPDVFARPQSLDLSQTRFEFCIVRSISWTSRILNFFRKRPKGENRFRLCSENEEKRIRVTILIRLDPHKEAVPEISTDPRLELTPRETYVTGIAV